MKLKIKELEELAACKIADRVRCDLDHKDCKCGESITRIISEHEGKLTITFSITLTKEEAEKCNE